MSGRITHVGLVVDDLEAAVERWTSAFDMKVAFRADIDVEGIRTAMLSHSGSFDQTSVELMEPTDKADTENAVARRLSKAGEGVYHLCMTCDDIDERERALKEEGVRVVRRPPTEPGEADRLVVHPKDANGVIIEYLQPREST